ncbi:MAG: phosphohistidine phosphatase SixA [Herminiimonas sp.]|nr:phosphohistidine phosphatase SixA [Herminiimonas sp.]
MELILWRHAEAEAGEPDLDRVLTAKGHKQAARMAEWLDAALPNSCRILASPAARAVQTAEALDRKFKVLPELAPGTSVATILAAANWPDSRDPVLLVGHQPTLGQIAARLISGTEQDWSIRKANVWWIVQRERGDEPDSGNGGDNIYLRAVMTPELVRK